MHPENIRPVRGRRVPGRHRSPLRFLSLLLSAVSVLAATPIRSEDPKRPSAQKQLQRTFNRLKKEKNLLATLVYDRGVAQGKSHQIVAKRFQTTYVGHVFDHRLMHAPKHKVFRTPEKGVFWETGRSPGGWRGITRLPTGSKDSAWTGHLHRSFYFPLDLLRAASRHVSTAEWAEESWIESGPQEVKKTESSSEADDSAETPDGKQSSGRPTGKTTVREKKEPLSKPWIVRVQVPPKLAHKKRVACGGWG